MQEMDRAEKILLKNEEVERVMPMGVVVYGSIGSRSPKGWSAFVH